MLFTEDNAASIAVIAALALAEDDKSTPVEVVVAVAMCVCEDCTPKILRAVWAVVLNADVPSSMCPKTSGPVVLV